MFMRPSNSIQHRAPLKVHRRRWELGRLLVKLKVLARLPMRSTSVDDVVDIQRCSVGTDYLEGTSRDKDDLVLAGD